MNTGIDVLSKITAKKLYFLTTFFVVFLTTFVGTKKYAPPIEIGLGLIAQEIQSDFPKDLDITITPEGIKGEAKYPVVLKTPTSLQGYITPNLAVIDPDGQETMLETYQALILVTNSRAVTLSSQGYQEVDLSKIPEIELNQKSIDKLTNNLSQIGKNAYLYVGGLFFVRGLVRMLVIWPAYLLVLTLAYNIIDKKVQKPTSTHLRELTLTFLPLLVLQTLLQLLNVKISFVPWFVIVHILFVIYLKGRSLPKEPGSEIVRKP